MNRNFLLLALLASLLLSCKTNSQEEVAQNADKTQKSILNNAIEHVDAFGFQKAIQLPNATLLDIRTIQEYNQGHIEGAINIDWYKRSFRNYVLHIPKDKPIVIYCRSGNRTSKTVNVLQSLGYKKIYNLQRGIIEWVGAKLPLTKDNSEKNIAFQKQIADTKTEDVNSSADKGKIYNVSAIDFNKVANRDDVTLVDIRTPQEFDAGHIKESINIDWYKRTFKEKALALPKDKAIAIYCRSGNRTSKAANVLQSLGFKNVINLAYGINDWNKNTLPLEK